MKVSKRLSRSRRGWLAFGVFVIAVLAAAVIGFIKAPDLYPLTTDPGADAAARATREAARSAAVTTTRASLLAALAGVGALVTIAINYRNSSIANETFRISERGHLTDRYAKAIELLGDTDSIAIRLGGIYALQQFASDTRRPEDQSTVVEVLSAFVRLNLAGPPTDCLPQPLRQPARQAEVPPAENMWRARLSAFANLRHPQPTSPHAPGADVLAAISVLAQLPDRGLPLRADFTGLDFTNIDLTGTRVSGGNLRQVNLCGANLRGADLRGADLRGAYLSGADLTGADLRGADLRGADLRGADLRGTHFLDAHLRGADLGGANLSGAVLSGARLFDAHLTGADLTGADLRGADLARPPLRADLRRRPRRRRPHRRRPHRRRPHRADLTRADLTRANLTGADLVLVRGLIQGQLSLHQAATARNVPNISAGEGG